MIDSISTSRETKNGLLGPSSYSVYWIRCYKELKCDGIGHWLGAGALLLEVGLGASGAAARSDKRLKERQNYYSK